MKAYSRSVALAFLAQIAPRIPLNIYQALLPRSPLGFFYHVISDSPLPHVKHLYPFKTSAEFEQDLHWLKANTTLVGYEDLKANLAGERTLPKNAAFISFDDGFRECYDVVRPLLLKHEVPCIFFLTADWIDNQSLFFRSKISLALDALSKLSTDDRINKLEELGTRFGSPQETAAFTAWLKNIRDPRSPILDEVCHIVNVDPVKFLSNHQPYLTRRQINEMQAEGFIFGAHTCNHTKLIYLNEEDQANQIIDSCRIIAEITNQSQVPFAFPFSGEGVSRTMLNHLKKTHPEIGLIFDTKKLLREPGILHRIWADKPAINVPTEKNLTHWLHDGYVRLLSRNQAHLS